MLHRMCANDRHFKRGSCRWFWWSIPRVALLLGCFAILAGCDSTQAHRARQYSAAYSALPQETQRRSIAGMIKVGDPKEAVYVAMGAPQRTEQHYNLGGIVESHWIYVGSAKPESILLTEDNHHYETVNDLRWSHPLGNENDRHIRVVLIGDKVDRIEAEATGDPANLVAPLIVLPQNPSAPVRALPSPGGW